MERAALFFLSDFIQITIVNNYVMCTWSILNLWYDVQYTITMVRKHTQFAQATELRKRGFTYVDIAKITGIAKSTVSNWLSEKPWSRKIRGENQNRAARENKKRISLLNKARSNQFNKLYDEAERSARIEYTHYKKNPLFLAGVMLFLAQGEQKAKNLIRFTSTNMSAHRICIRFACEFLGVPKEKVRFLLILYPSMNVKVSVSTWAQTLKIPTTQFYKHQTIQHKSSKPTLHSGVGNTIIGGTVLKRKLSVWIAQASKEWK